MSEWISGNGSSAGLYPQVLPILINAAAWSVWPLASVFNKQFACPDYMLGRGVANWFIIKSWSCVPCSQHSSTPSSDASTRSLMLHKPESIFGFVVACLVWNWIRRVCVHTLTFVYCPHSSRLDTGLFEHIIYEHFLYAHSPLPFFHVSLGREVPSSFSCEEEIIYWTACPLDLDGPQRDTCSSSVAGRMGTIYWKLTLFIN